MSIWQSIHDTSIPAPAVDWLSFRNSMTMRLRAHCDNTLTVQVIAHDWQRATPEDTDYLGIEREEPIIAREVLLCCYDQPWMYARTALPKRLVESFDTELVDLGTRPIGEILFADPGMTRSEFEVARLTVGEAAYEQAITHTGLSEDTLWARRSIFHLPNKGDLAITEVFLPICWTS